MKGTALIFSLLVGLIGAEEVCTDGQCSATATVDIIKHDRAEFIQGTLKMHTTMHRAADTTRLVTWRLTVQLAASVWALALLTALVVIYTKWYLQEFCNADRVMWCGMLIAFVVASNYTIVIADSFQLSVALGKNEAYSGKMVGMYMLADIFGAVFVWSLGKIVAGFWRSCRLVWGVGLILNAVGAVVYMYVARVASGTAVEELNTLAWLLLCGRFLSGAGSGMCSQMTRSMIPNVAEFSQRPFWATWFGVWTMFGLGTGPVLAAGATWLDNRYFSWRLESAGSLQIVLCIGAVLLVISSASSLQDAADKFTSDFASRQSDTAETLNNKERQLGAHHIQFEDTASESIIKRKRVVLGCLTMSGLRCFTVSGLEVATALILEETFFWNTARTGFFIGVVLLLGIPMKLLHARVHMKLKDVQWVKLFAWVAGLATMMLTSGASHILHVLVPHMVKTDACAWLLLFADAVLFPLLCLSDAMSLGIMQQHLLPGYFLLDPQTVALLNSLMAASLGRFFGSWTARAVYKAYGLNGFALSQISTTALFILIFEMVVHPCVLTKRSAKGSTMQFPASSKETGKS